MRDLQRITVAALLLGLFSLGLAAAEQNWVLRSHHFLYGMPMPKDTRYNFDADGDGNLEPGISVLVREGFVVGHCDKYKVPLWVAVHWTSQDLARSISEPSYDRNWKPDRELPAYARAETDYNYAVTHMDRGHMARHKDNSAWGKDNVDAGCFMSNSAPQKDTLNRGPWLALEDQHRNVVGQIGEIWVISGTIFNKIKEPQKTGNGIGIPDATYKVIAWYDSSGKLNARGYILKQTDTDRDLTKYLKPIKEIEDATGLDFFPELDDVEESALESAKHVDLWGVGVGAATSAAATTKTETTVKEKADPNKITAPFVASAGSKVYHRNSCSYVRNINASNLVTFNSEAEAKASGRRGCSRCIGSTSTTRQSVSKQCAAITKKGTRCKRKAAPGSIYCWQHKK